MSTNKRIDQICCMALVFTLLITFLFLNAEKLGVQAVSADAGYASRLFDTSLVHSIDIIMDDWDAFVANCSDENYETCTIVIDGEKYKNTAIRAKGNTSLSLVESYGNDRYSFKIEFDHYDNANTCHGLDKLCLNNIIQDNTYMKDYLTYQMMSSFGVDAPLCSYAYVTVNGEDWGLYLAVEGVEEGFLQRNYGSQYGKLYKPDSNKMDVIRSDGQKFDMPDVFDHTTKPEHFEAAPGPRPGALPEMAQMTRMSEMPGSDALSLIYTDNEYDSYSSLFDNAKTKLTDSDRDRLIASIRQLNEQEALEEVIDIEKVIRYFVVHNFVLNFDSYTGSIIHNYYLYEKNGILSMIPWDYNLAFGGFMSESDAETLINYPIDTPVSGGTLDSRPMLSWIFADEKYTQLYHQYFADFISRNFDENAFSNWIDSIETLIAPYVEKDPTKFCTYDAFQTGVAALKEFCLLRAESINGQLDGTIPSTSDGQKQDSSSLIGGNDINISDMGSMGDMMMPGKFRPDKN